MMVLEQPISVDIGWPGGCGVHLLPSKPAGLPFMKTVVAQLAISGAPALFLSPNLGHPGIINFLNPY
jgi:hypothetical protein